MHIETRTTDSKGRVLLPISFASSTVVVEQVGDTEVRSRLARIIPVDEIRFVEEAPKVLSDEERNWFIQLLETPPPANEALRKLQSEARD
jgi:hypothetical protein